MNIAVLTKGDSDHFLNMKWRRHTARINGWLNDYIYIIKEIDLSYKKSAKKESERNKNRFSIISNQDTLVSTVDTIFPLLEPTTAPTQKVRLKIWTQLTEALIDLLYEVDEKVIDLIEGHIVLISEDLYKLLKKKKGKNTSNCIRDVPTTSMNEETKEKLEALRTIFDVVISDLLTQYKDSIKIKKKIYEDEEFQNILDTDWNKIELLNTFAPLKVEVDKFDELMDIDNTDNDKDEENEKLKETILKLQKVVKEQSELLREKEDQDIRTKKQAAQHLKDALLAADKNKPAITTSNIYQQILQTDISRNNKKEIEILPQNKQEKRVSWIKSKLDTDSQSTISSSIDNLAKKIGRLSGSNAISTENIIQIIQCGMFHIYLHARIQHMYS